MTVLVIFDTETTGLDGGGVDEVCQFACVVHRESDPISRTLSFESLCNPGKPISAESAAVHGISDAMVAGAPPAPYVLQEWFKEVMEFAAGDSVVLGGHNTGFDWRFIAKHVSIPVDVLPLCTMRLARRVDPLATNHTLEYLYRERNQLASDRTIKAHDAMCDVWMCFELLHHWRNTGQFLNNPTYNGIAHSLLEPVLLEVMPFGKNKGKRFEDLPLHYLRWLNKQDESMDMDVRYTAGIHLGGRRG